VIVVKTTLSAKPQYVETKSESAVLALPLLAHPAYEDRFN